jgi:hypothetical protein
MKKVEDVPGVFCPRRTNIFVASFSTTLLCGGARWEK